MEGGIELWRSRRGVVDVRHLAPDGHEIEPRPQFRSAGVGHFQPPTFFNGKPLGPDHLGNIGGVYPIPRFEQSGGRGVAFRGSGFVNGKPAPYKAGKWRSGRTAGSRVDDSGHFPQG